MSKSIKPEIVIDPVPSTPRFSAEAISLFKSAKRGSGSLSVRFESGDAARFGTVDEKAGSLSDVAICLEGEAKGHGVFLDAAFVQAVCEQGNAVKDGLKCRFGHPGFLGDAIGTYLGRLSGFTCREMSRADGTKAAGCFATLVFSRASQIAPGGNLSAYMIQLAKECPDAAGMSICFSYSDFKVKCADSSELLFSKCLADAQTANPEMSEGAVYDLACQKFYDASADGRLYAVLGSLTGADFTDDPAATEGVFSATDQLTAALDGLNAIRAKSGLSAVQIIPVDQFKRLDGYQKAKDKEIAELSASHAAALKTISDQLATSKSDLEKANASLSAVSAERDQKVAALADAGKQLTALKSAHDQLTGRVLVPSGVASSSMTWSDALSKCGNDYARARQEFAAVWEAQFGSHGLKPLAPASAPRR